MITSMMLGRLYVRYMGLEKRMSEVLMMPGIVYVKAKRDLDVLDPTNGVLELHITRANFQAKIWLQADPVIKLTETIDLWQEGTN